MLMQFNCVYYCPLFVVLRCDQLLPKHLASSPAPQEGFSKFIWKHKRDGWGGGGFFLLWWGGRRIEGWHRGSSLQVVAALRKGLSDECFNKKYPKGQKRCHKERPNHLETRNCCVRKTIPNTKFQIPNTTRIFLINLENSETNTNTSTKRAQWLQDKRWANISFLDSSDGTT